ncbi:hypothetical protein [Marispirochaeta sp.]|uniref:hypothetical protein n=1 Tax=Marispirochaeta sp. TaxID=2038653 RepID=UPI0029C83533|nr:hypothetical protein [Marispirochaeta sp.]
MFKSKQVALIIVLFFAVTSCYESKKDVLTTTEQTKYVTIYSEALNSKDPEIVEKALEYIDELIYTDSGQAIKSIFYNKAQLLHSIGRYDDAIAVLITSPQEHSSFYLATLFLRIQQSQDVAKKILQNFILRSKYQLLHDNIEHAKELELVNSIYIMLKLSGAKLSSFYEEISVAGILTKEEFSTIEKKNSFQVQTMLEGLWPLAKPSTE